MPATLALSWTLELRSGDQLKDRPGNTASIGSRNPDGAYQAVKEDGRGNYSQVRVTVTASGDNWTYR